MKRTLLIALMLLMSLLQIGITLGQCECMGGCGSGCDCGCNDSANSPPPGGPSLTGFDAVNVVMKSRLSLSEMGVTSGSIRGNDCWGWTYKNREFALFGLTNGTAFVEITNPEAPVYLGTLPTGHGIGTWRDMKVYNNRAYIVADGNGNSTHGVQVFNLERLLNITTPPIAFTEDANFKRLGRAHNIAINEDSGFAYVIGSPSLGSLGGPIVLDLKQGVEPVLAAVYSGDGYCHDTQVVKYNGADRRYREREIAFCSNEDTLTILDVSNKKSIQQLSRTTYAQSAYSHQGWLSPDQRYFFMNDELDEQQNATTKTRTHVWSLLSLRKPIYLGFVEGTNRTIDHNLYVHGNYIFEANYSSGLRILDANLAKSVQFQEVGYFDTYTTNNSVNFNGAWSVYPFFKSGNIIVSDQQNGLFILRFTPP